MTYASTVLTQELQRAVKNRAESHPTDKTPSPTPPTLDYKVSKEAREHLERLRIYREKAKQVRVGTY